jgi:hypothetical protein
MLRGHAVSPRQRPDVLCRQIGVDDLPAVAALLARGFPGRSRQEWLKVLNVLDGRPKVAGFPRYGHLLESCGRPVGVVLLITTLAREGAEQRVLCNLSSWYVEPQFRGCAAWLSARAFASGPATYLNLSAVPNTWRTIEAQGFKRCRQGVFLALPALARSAFGSEVVSIGDPAPFAGKLPAHEIKLIADHMAHGCLALVGIAPQGISPFVFRYRRLRGVLSCAQLIYCRSLAEVARFAGPIGRHFGLGAPVLLINADGAIAGLPGWYFAGTMPCYAKGLDVPWAGNLAYTEAALFGF